MREDGLLSVYAKETPLYHKYGKNISKFNVSVVNYS